MSAARPPTNMNEQDTKEASPPPADPEAANSEALRLITDDLQARAKWAEHDALILKRRLAERSKKKNKPYPGAPNFVVPIIDDMTREISNQQLNMISNAPLYACFVSLDAQTDAAMLNRAELAFDTYLRHIIRIRRKIALANDCKNARGMAILKVIREDLPRFGVMPDVEVRDPRDVVVPATTREMSKAERLTDIYRYTPDQFEKVATARGWDPAAVKAVKVATTHDRKPDNSNEEDLLETTKQLIGIETGGTEDKTIIIFEYWHYATADDAVADKSQRVKELDKCCTIFCPASPKDILKIFPWRERDSEQPLEPAAAQQEALAAAAEGRPPLLSRVIRGADRTWPYVQARFEDRSEFYYDTRGVGHLCMDEQIGATAELNGKMTMIDFFQLPLFTSTGSRNSANVTFEPGSFLPEGTTPVTMPQVPAQFDFDIESFKRTAGRRVGAVSQYQFSGEMSRSKKVQKTATEVTQETVHSNVLSTADVDRFNDPWAELFQQLWDDLARLGVQLPLIQAGRNVGVAQENIYAMRVLIVPAGNAKTLNPDLQFQRAQQAWNFMVSGGQLGIVFDPETAMRDILSNWDPVAANRWLGSANKQGPGGQPPVYLLLQQIAQKLAAMELAIKETGKLAMQTSEHMDGRTARELPPSAPLRPAPAPAPRPAGGMGKLMPMAPGGMMGRKPR